MSRTLDLTANGLAYAMLEQMPPYWDAGDFSLTMDVQIDEPRSYAALVSYAVPEEANELLLMTRPQGLALFVGGQVEQTDIDIADGLAHAIAVRFSRPNPNQLMPSRLELWIDGIVRAVKPSVPPLRRGGCLVLGQDQDRLAGGFDGGQALRGRIGNFMIRNGHDPVAPGSTVVRATPGEMQVRRARWLPPTRLDIRDEWQWDGDRHSAVQPAPQYARAAVDPFGGKAFPDEAWMDVDPDSVSPEEMAALLQAGQGLVEEWPSVSASFWLMLPGGHTGRVISYRVPGSDDALIVHAESDSLDFWLNGIHEASVPRPPAGRWVFIVASCSLPPRHFTEYTPDDYRPIERIEGGLEVFVDGESQAHVAPRSDELGLRAHGRLTIGSDSELPVGHPHSRISASLRDFAIWDRTLGQSDAVRLGRTKLRGDEMGLRYLASAETAAVNGMAWSDEAWLAFDAPTRGYAAIEPLPPGAPTTAISVSFWLRCSTRADSGAVVSNYIAGRNDELVIMRPSNLYLFVGSGGVSTGVDVADGAWHFVACTWASSTGTARVFVDGRLRWEDTLRRGAVLGAGGAWIVGQEQNAEGGGFTDDRAFVGELVDVAIWSTALSADRVLEVMQTSRQGDEQDLWVVASSESARMQDAAWVPRTSLHLTRASQQRAVIADVGELPTEAWSVSMWVKAHPVKLGSVGRYDAVLSYAVPECDNELLVFRMHKVQIFLGGTRYETGIDVADDRWHLIAVTCHQETLCLYVDGVLAWSQDGVQHALRSHGTLVVGQEQDEVGGGFDASQAFAGALDDITLWSRPLSSTTLAALFAGQRAADVPGWLLQVNEESAEVLGTTWCDRVHPAAQHQVFFEGLRQQLEPIGIRLGAVRSALATPTGGRTKLTLRAQLSCAGAGGAIAWEADLDLGTYNGRAGTISLGCPRRVGPADIVEALSIVEAAHPMACLAAAIPSASRPWQLDVHLGEDQGASQVLLQGECDLLGHLPGSFSIELAVTASGPALLHATGLASVYTLDTGLSTFIVHHHWTDFDFRADGYDLLITPDAARLTLTSPVFFGNRIRLRSPTLEVPITPSGCEVSLSRDVLHVDSPLDGPGSEELGLTFGPTRTLDVAWRRADAVVIRSRRDRGRNGRSSIVAAWKEVSYRGQDIPTPPETLEIRDITEESFDALLAAVDSSARPTERLVDALQNVSAPEEGLGLLQLLADMLDDVPAPLGALSGIIAVTDVEATVVPGGEGLTISGVARLFGVPGGRFGIEFTYDRAGNKWDFRKIMATTGLSYSQTGSLIELGVEFTGRLEVTGFVHTLAFQIGLFDDLFSVDLPDIDLAMPPQLPDLFSIPGIDLPSFAKEIGGELIVGFGDSTISVDWTPRIDVDFWIGTLGARLDVSGEVDLDQVSAELTAKASVHAFGIPFSSGRVSVDVSQLTSLGGLIDFALGSIRLDKVNPAELAIRFAVNLANAVWEAFEDVVDSVGDALGLSGEKEGSKVGFLDFVRTAVMWHGKYYFFHGWKDVVWRINDRDVDGDWPKSASGSWTHMPVITESRPLRNIIKVDADIGGRSVTVLVFDFANKAIGRCYTIGDPYRQELPVSWHNRPSLPGLIHTSVYWRGQGTYIFHDKGLVSRLTARWRNGRLELAKEAAVEVSAANGWWDATTFTTIPSVAVEGDRDGGRKDTDVLYFFDFCRDEYIRFRHPPQGSVNAKRLTRDDDDHGPFPRKINDGFL